MARARHATVPAILVVLAIVIAACGGSSATPSESIPAPEASSPAPAASNEPTPEPTPTPEPIPGATQAATPSADANTFVSRHYPYALTLAPGVALVGWHDAARTWNGQAIVNIATLADTDRTVVAEGGLLIIGSEAESLDEFADRFEANGPRYRGCKAAENRIDATIAGVPAIGFTQICGDDESDAFARVALFNDGWGIGASIQTTLGNEVATRDRLIELLEGLDWRIE